MKAKKLLALTLALILALSCMSLTAFAENATYLDLEEGDDYLDTKTGIEQKYTATVTTNKTDKTKVEVSWKLEDITVSVTNNKVWDTEKLIWVNGTANQNTATANDVTAEFDFVNRSSINIDAQIIFKVASGFTAITPTFTDNGVTEKADGIITLGTKADGEDTDNDGEIKATISPVDADFASLTENKTEQNYGTYTVTIREQAPAIIGCATFTDYTTMSWEELKDNNYDVTDTSIGDFAFENCDTLKTITIPDSVESIGISAFDGCESLKEITIPDSVESIGDSAFNGCTSLVTITIPNSVTLIGDYAFYGCESLKEITIPNSVTSISNSAFESCESLVTITIPDSVESIGDSAFNGCTSLATITIPNSVKSIGEYAFFSCESLKEITIPNSVTSIGAFAFSSCNSLETITIPDSVESIGDREFSDCYSLKTITIPASVTSIGDEAFTNCSSLETITIPNSVESIGESAFFGCSNLIIYCSAEQKPDGWDNNWNPEDCTVIWGN